MLTGMTAADERVTGDFALVPRPVVSSVEELLAGATDR
jgi:hypothetical protein